MFIVQADDLKEVDVAALEAEAVAQKTPTSTPIVPALTTTTASLAYSNGPSSFAVATSSLGMSVAGATTSTPVPSTTTLPVARAV